MKKIIFVTPQFKTGGGNRVFIEISNVIANDNQVVILYPNNSSTNNSFHLKPQIEVLKIGSLALNKMAKLINVFKLFRFINKNYQDDYVIISDPIISSFSFLLKVNNVVRFVQADDVNIYNGGEVIKSKILLYIYKCLTKLMFHLPFTYVFNSNFTFEEYKKFGRRDVKQNIVHPAIDKKIFAPVSRNSAMPYRICTIGRVHPIKGFDVFLEAINILPLEYQKMIGEIVIVSGDDLTRFDLKSNSKIKIISPNSDAQLAEIYSSTDIFISSSFSEGFGLPPLEAMACGCAVIVSKSGGISEYALDNVNCLQFEPGDSNKLSE